jgi:DNA-binding NtrC family response regulator
MCQVLEVMKDATSSRFDLLIIGEAGTGRETLARAIHACSSEDGPFVSIDCAAIAPRNIDAELFGKSARRRNGWRDGSTGPEELRGRCKVAQASNGTLFLRRLVEMPVGAQATLGRLLQDGVAVDGETGNHLAVDVRLIAAVEPSFQQAVERARVEPVLFERFPLRIELPPLRKRREDIPALSAWFLDQWCGSTASASKTFTEPALALLAAFPWKGNGHELGNFVRVVAANVRGTRLGPEEILAHIRLESGALAAYRLPLREARRRFEREYIATVIEQHHGRIENAAQTLGIQRTNLYRKLRQLHLPRNGGRSDTENRNRA